MPETEEEQLALLTKAWELLSLAWEMHSLREGLSSRRERAGAFWPSSDPELQEWLEPEPPAFCGAGWAESERARSFCRRLQEIAAGQQ